MVTDEFGRDRDSKLREQQEEVRDADAILDSLAAFSDTGKSS